ncbi:hypothetical protein HDU85_001642 [Gaertneriomyces sp. JEL0708]|nr:hypothetical protein HDU85_001642 [Gaertneriomyces sp. JEL0708]
MCMKHSTTQQRDEPVDDLVTSFPNLTGKNLIGTAASQTSSLFTISITTDVILDHDCQTADVEACVAVAWAQLLRGYVGEQSVGFHIASASALVTTRVCFSNDATNAALVEDVRFALNTARTDAGVVADTTLVLHGAELPNNLSETSQVVLSLSSTPDSKLIITLTSHACLFSQSHGDHVLHQLLHVLSWTLANPTRPALALVYTQLPQSRLSLLNAEPLERTSPQIDPEYILLHHLFERTASLYPDNIALDFLHDLSGRRTTLTYRELNTRANQLAGVLLSVGVTPDDMIPIYVEKSVDLYISILAVLKSGAAYVPLASDSPIERIAFVAKDVSATMMIVDGNNAKNCLHHNSLSLLEVINLDDISTQTRLLQQSNANPSSSHIAQHHLAYVLYTSGSTGLPKGVQLEHGNAIESILSHYPIIPHAEPYHYNEEKFLQFASPTFDVSVFEMFFPWSLGMALASTSKRWLLEDLEAVINTLQVTHMELTPTVAGLVSRSKDGVKGAKGVKAMLTIGECLTQRVVDEWAGTQQEDGVFDGALHNAYGPTECAIHCAMAANFELDVKPTNIGLPLDTCTLYVMPQLESSAAAAYIVDGLPLSQTVLPVGHVGELCVAGKQVARGYLNRPESNSKAFFTDPHAKDPTTRLYRTGDLVRLLPNSTLEFVGRVADDGQVKLRGQRIELGEISHVLASSHEDIKDVVTLVINDERGAGGKSLVSFISVQPEGQVVLQADGMKVMKLDDVDASCREAARNRLPSYMIPNELVFIDGIPLNLSGKTDRKRLTKLFGELDLELLRPQESDEDEQDAEEWESTPNFLALRRIVSDMAKVHEVKVKPRTSIFHLGIDSLGVIVLCSRLRAQGLNASVSEVLQNPTIEAITRLVSNSQNSELDSERQALKIAFNEKLDGLSDWAAGALQIPVDHIEDAYPCTTVQEGFLVESLKNPDGRQCYDRILVKVEPGISADVICGAWNRMIATNPIFRTAFVRAENLDHVDPSWLFVQVVYTPDGNPRQGSESISTLFVQEQRDVAVAVDCFLRSCKATLDIPMCQARFIEVADQTGEQGNWLVMMLHHAIYDGWSVPLILKDLEARVEGQTLSPHPSFKAIVEYQHTTPASQFSQSVSFWARYLADLPTFEPFPTLTTSTTSAPEPMHVTSLISQLPTSLVESYCREIGITPQTLCQVAWAKVLSRYTGTQDVTFGATFSGRTLPVDGVHEVLGPCIQVTPIRIQLNNDMASLLKRVQRESAEILEHAFIPLRRITEILHRKVDGGGHGLFDTWLVYQKVDFDGKRKLLDVVSTDDAFEDQILMEVDPKNESFLLRVRCRSETVPQEHAKYLLEQFEDALVHIVASTTPRLVSSVTHNIRLSVANPEPTLVTDDDLLIHQHVEKWARKMPDKIAVEHLSTLEPFRTETLTYGQLNRRANRLAHTLLKHGVQQEDVIPVCFDKSPLMYTAILAVLKAGAAYLPIDPMTPADRVSFIMSDCGAKVALTVSNYSGLMSAADGLKVLFADSEVYTTKVENPHVKIDHSTLAYVLYTSGTTGQPKGVMIEHGNVAANLKSLMALYPATNQTSKFLQAATYTFDVSVFDIFYSFACGITLCCVGKETLFSSFATIMQKMNITHVDLTSTTAGLIRRQDVPELKVLIQAGEALTRRVYDEWAGVKGVTLINAYGPTETMNVCVVHCGVDQTSRLGVIGKALETCSAAVIDMNNDTVTPLPIGSLGELCISGPQVGRGYLNRPELNESKYKNVPGFGRLYRTGDVARMLHNGDVFLVGRLDDQVKVNGLRIELGEINAALVRSRPEEIRDAFTLVSHRGEGRDVLVSFVAIGRTGNNGCSVAHPSDSVQTLVRSAVDEAKRKLPYYMVPNIVIPVTDFPTGSTGKVDRRALTRLYEELDANALGHFTSGTSGDDSGLVKNTKTFTTLEKHLRELIAILAKVDVSGISRGTSIFQLGLDSISAIQLSSKLKTQHGIVFSMVDVMQNPSIERMAEVIVSRQSEFGEARDVTEEKALDEIRVEFRSFEQAVLSHCTEIDVTNVYAVYPCTPMQESMLAQKFRGGDAYMNHLVFEFDSDSVDKARLRRAWQSVTDSNEILRSGFAQVGGIDGAGEALFAMIVYKRWELKWQDRMCEGDMDCAIAEIVSEASCANPSEPMLLFSFLEADYKQYLVMSAHHALYDGRALQVMLSQAWSIYNGRPIYEITPFSWALERILLNARLQGAKELWKDHLAGYDPVPFPDLSGALKKEGGHHHYERTISIPLQQIEEGCMAMSSTLQAVGMATWAKVLTAYTGTQDCVFGVVFAGRAEPSDVWDTIIGPCVNTIPCRIRVGESTNAQLVQNVQAEYTKTMRYQQTPLRKILKWTGTAESGFPLFDTLFVFDRSSVVGENSGVKFVKGFSEVEANVAVELIIADNGTLQLLLACKNDILSLEQTQLIADQFEAVLIDLICNTHAPSKELNIDPRLLSIPSKEIEPYTLPEDIRFMHSWVEDYASRRPADVAIEFADEVKETGMNVLKVTYDELNSRANQVAHFIRSQGVKVGDMVPVCIPRSPLLYAAILGVSKAGAAYVPVDPDAPAERKQFIIQESEAKMALTVVAQQGQLQPGLPDVTFMSIDHPQTLKVIMVNSEMNLGDANVKETDIAYVLFTSGTTGKPKGVLVEHRNVIQAITAFQHVIPIDKGARLLQFASCAFDVSIFEMFLSWSKGIVLCSAPKDVLLRDIELVLRSFRITHVDLTPSVAAFVKRDNVPTLEILVTGGEALTQQVLKEWTGDGKYIYNAYGPTEATIGCTTRPKVQITDKPGNIGWTFDNVAGFVMSTTDGELRPVLRGAIGELCVGGPLVTRGYLKQPDLTDKLFVRWKNPATSKVERIYKTGDLVRLMSDGSLEFLGRADDQVKINGIRIEVDEINFVIKQGHQDVKSAVTMVIRDNEQSKKRIVSFVVLHEDRACDEITFLKNDDKIAEVIHHILAEAKCKLPVYMVPSHILPINRLPLGTTGKADTKALGRMFLSRPVEMNRMHTVSADTRSWNKTDMETMVCDVICKIAKVSSATVGPQTTIFELGIDSLSAIILSSALRKEGHDLAVSTILQNPTVPEIASICESLKHGSSADAAVSSSLKGKRHVQAFNAKYIASVAKQMCATEDDIVQVYPCSPLQQGMIVQYVQSGGTNYVNQFTFELAHTVDLDQFRAAWMLVAMAHDVLRTGFVSIDDGVAYAQVVFKHVAENFLEELQVEDSNMEIMIQEYKVQVVEEVKLCTPPIRVCVVSSKERKKFVLTMHHALYDGWSLALLLQDVNHAYETSSVVQRPSFSACIEYIMDISPDEAAKFWKGELANFSPAPFPELTGIRSPQLYDQEAGAELIATLPVSVVEEFCRSVGITPLALGQVAWAKVLKSYVGEDDIVFGNVVSGRTIPVDGAEDILGPCFNTVPCRVHLGSNQSNVDVLRNVTQRNAAAMPYQHVSLSSIQRWTGQSSDMPLFDTLFLYQSGEADASKQKLWKTEGGLAKIDFPISVEMEALSRTLVLRAACRGNIGQARFIELLMQQLDAVITDIVGNPQASADHLCFDLAKHSNVLSIANAPPKVYSQVEGSLLHSSVEYQAKATPHTTALEWATSITVENGATIDTYTYDFFNREANRIAHVLLEHNAQGQIIPIIIDKSPLMYLSIVATMKAGAAYIPVDPDLPFERKQFMVEDSSTSIILTNAEYAEQYARSGAKVLALDAMDLSRFPDTNPDVRIEPTDLAYVLYTSGTTGKPKGVMIEHHSAVQCVEAIREMLDLDDNSKFLQMATCSFDVSISEMFCAWSHGCAIAAAPKDVMLKDLSLAINALGVTILDLTPTVAGLLRRDMLTNVKHLALGGEAVTQKVLDEWAGHDDVTLLNAYGPTETTIGCTLYVDVQKNSKPSNIGKPYPSCSAFVVDDGQHIVPLGGVGELVIGGAQVARGYLNRPELTSEKFVQLETGVGRVERVYRTGDLVRLLPDGHIEFLGRIDDQVKLNGIRIELGEVSAVLSACHDTVQEVVTLVLRHPDQSRDQLISFICLRASSTGTSASEEPFLTPLAFAGSPATQEVRDAAIAAAQKLPMYMVPAHMFLINQLPLGKTGKVDKKEIARLYRSLDSTILRAGTDEEDDGSSWTEQERSMRTIVASIAGMAELSIGRHSSIFQLGLDSISAIRLSSRLTAVGMDLAVSDIMKCPTIARMYALLEERAASGASFSASSKQLDISSEFRQTLAEYEERVLADVAEKLDQDRSSFTAAYPCTPLQEGMLAQTLKTNGRLYFNHTIMELDPEADIHRLRHSWNLVIESNDILRTSFHTVADVLSTQAQVVHKQAWMPWTVVNVNSEPELQQAADVHIEKTIEDNKTLEKPPLAFGLILSPTKNWLIVSMHHALYDGWSFPLIIADVYSIYESGSHVQRPQFRPLAEYIVSRSSEANQKYWTQNLDDCTTSVFPEDLRGTIDSVEGAYGHSVISQLSPKEVEAASQRMGVSLQAVAQAAWAKVLSCYTGETDVVFGHVVSGRAVPVDNAEDILGPSFNTIPCRVPLQPTWTNSELVNHIHNGNINCIPYQHTPLRSIMKWTGTPDGLALFDTLFVFQRGANADHDDRKTLWKVLDGKVDVDYAVSVEFELTQEHVEIRAACRAQVMPEAQLHLLLRQMETIFVDIVREPTAKGLSFARNAPDELMSVCNPNPTVHDTTGCELMHNLFERTAMRLPNHNALEFATEVRADGTVKKMCLTYEELNRRSNQVAEMLVLKGVKPDTVVPICAERSVWLYVAILAVLKAGAAYVPVDPEAPLDRKRYLFSDVSATHAVVSARQLVLLHHEDLPVKLVCVDDLLAPVIAQYSPENPNVPIDPTSLGYVLYTSGTTGLPKGVQVEHRNVLQATMCFDELCRCKPESRITQFANFTFDVSIFEMFFAWKSGITLVSASKNTLLTDLQLLLKSLNITHTLLTPTVAAMLQRNELPSLELLVAGGEALSQRVLDVWAPDGALCNAYGPTEVTVGCTILTNVPINARPSNIGHVYSTCSAYVLTDSLEVVPRGGVGELCIGGSQVTRGYLGRPDLTKERFINIPGIEGRLYRTGDYVKMLEDDTIIFLGRRDDQVKLNGLRIELGEISAAVGGAHPAVADAITLVLKHPRQSRDQLVTFMALKHVEESASEVEVLSSTGPHAELVNEVVRIGISDARRKLPSYMVPSTVLVLNRLPRGLTNKVDRRALEKLYVGLELTELAQSRELPDENISWTDLERSIQKVLMEVSKLSQDEIGKMTSLFHLGLDSISAILVSSKLRALGLQLTVADILQNPNVEAMARLELEKRGYSDAAPTNPKGAITDAAAITLGEKFIMSLPDRLDGITSADIESVLPATPAQVYTVSAWLASDRQAFMACFPFLLKDKRVDLGKLRRTWENVVERHRIYRTTFVPTTHMEMPLVQVTLRKPNIVWAEQTVRQKISLDAVKKIIREEQRVKPDLRTPPIRVRILKFKDRTVFLLSMHHALYDGWTLPLLHGELNNFFFTGTPSQAKDSFVDFVEYVENQDLTARHEPYWKSVLNGCKPTLLPSTRTDIPEGTPSDFHSRMQLLVEGALSNAASYESKCKEAGVTMHSVFLAAWSKLLAQRTGSDTPVFGMYHAGRSAPVDGVEKLMAPCINVLPFVAKNVDKPLVELAKDVQKELVTQNDLGQVGIHKITQWAGVQKPLWNVNVNYLKFLENNKTDSTAEDNTQTLFESLGVNASSINTIEDANASAQTAQTSTSSIPPNLSGLEHITAVHQIDMDLEIAVRGTSVDIGVFCNRRLMTSSDARQLISELCEYVTEGLDMRFDNADEVVRSVTAAGLPTQAASIKTLHDNESERKLAAPPSVKSKSGKKWWKFWGKNTSLDKKARART